MIEITIDDCLLNDPHVTVWTKGQSNRDDPGSWPVGGEHSPDSMPPLAKIHSVMIGGRRARARLTTAIVCIGQTVVVEFRGVGPFPFADDEWRDICREHPGQDVEG